MKVQFLLFFFFTFSVVGQNMETYSGGWGGTIADDGAFTLKVEIEEKGDRQFVFNVFNSRSIVSKEFSGTTEEFTLNINESLTFRGKFNKEGSAIRGFFKSGLLLYHVELKKNSAGTFTGQWNILMIDSLKNQNLYLSIENTREDSFEAYPIFGDNRFTGTWCANFNKDGNLITFKDFKTGLKFKGELLGAHIDLEILLNDTPLTKVRLNSAQDEWEIGLSSHRKDDGVALGRDKKELLGKMEKEIGAGAFPNTHSILIAKEGETIYENYFQGYNPGLPHDQRSASKSISSAALGIAVNKNLLSPDDNLFEFLPMQYHQEADSNKRNITIHHLLTMSSGLDAVDFGIDRKSVASENNYQPTPDWLKTIVNAPMINTPGSMANYGSANPYLLGVILDSVLNTPVELFLDENLFEPLNISGYIIQTDLTGRPYFGGGMYLTPRHMLKFGQLYLNKGIWKGKRILSEDWVNSSFQNYLPLDNTADKNGYGYLWWHHNYQIKGRNIKTLEARGAGGQYIFVIPELQVVVAITSGNYNNGKTQQPEELLEKFILPGILAD